MKTAEEWVKRLKERGSPLRFVASGEWLVKRAHFYRAEGVEDERLVETLVDRELQGEQDRLMDRVLAIIQETALVPPAITRIVDVGIGPGELATRLGALDASPLHYTGVDFESEFINEARQRLEQSGGVPTNFELGVGDGTRLVDTLPIDSADVAIWGKLGEHLTEQDSWIEGLKSVNAILRRNGAFVLYEPVRERNPDYQVNPLKNPGTYIRSLTEYDDALANFRRVKTQFQPFCDEVYAIAVWRKMR